jgi:hypothetical protein
MAFKVMSELTAGISDRNWDIFRTERCIKESPEPERGDRDQQRNPAENQVHIERNFVQIESESE